MIGGNHVPEWLFAVFYVGLLTGLPPVLLCVAGLLLRSRDRKKIVLYPTAMEFGSGFGALAIAAFATFCLYPSLPNAWRSTTFPTSRASYLGGAAVACGASIVFFLTVALKYRLRRKLIAAGARCEPSHIERRPSRVKIEGMFPARDLWMPLGPFTRIALLVWRADLHTFEYGHNVSLKTFEGTETLAFRKGCDEGRYRPMVCYAEDRPEVCCLLLERKE